MKTKQNQRLTFAALQKDLQFFLLHAHWLGVAKQKENFK